jgi:hypothetical protein
VCHKETKLNIDSELRKTIHVGEKIFQCDYYDYDGENISDKNSTFCELTAIYWIWKNSKSSIMGLEHYRRFFRNPTISLFNDKMIDGKTIKKIFGKYDVILPKKHYLKRFNVEEDYKYGESLGNHIFNDFLILENVIKTHFNDYYNDFCAIKKLNYYYPFNMIICEKKVFDSFCSFLFPILMLIESKIDVSSRKGNTVRAFGYLAERLMNLWIVHNKKKVKELSVIINDDSSALKKFFRRIKSWL